MAEVLALCYHAVSDTWPAPLSVTPGQLQEHLELLLERGYRPATFTEAVLDPPAPKTLAITFDDGFRSVFALARPILDRLGAVGTVYVPTDFPGGPDARLSWPGIDKWVGGEYDSEMRPMSWDEVRELGDAGWEVGAHTKSHPHLTTLSDGALEAELGESRRIVEEQLGRQCPSFAYPYGDHNDRVVEATGRAGFQTAGTVPGRLKKGGPLRWPRVVVNAVDDTRRFRIKVSRPMRLVRASPIWPEKTLARRGA